MNHMRRLISFASLMSFWIVSVGCINEKPQSYWESQAADVVKMRLSVYDALNPGVAKTNVGQIMTNIDGWEYPVDLHREFLRYGNQAGFTNSFYEKYVFIPESVTNPFPIAGAKVVLMNAQPFRGGDNHRYRMVVHENPQEGSPMYYSCKLVPEQVIQRVFKEAGVPIPEPPRFPPPPPIPPPPAVPFSQKKFEYFRDLAVQLGMNSYNGRVLQNLVEGAGVISLALVCFLIFRRIIRRIIRRSRKQNEMHITNP